MTQLKSPQTLIEGTHQPQLRTKTTVPWNLDPFTRARVDMGDGTFRKRNRWHTGASCWSAAGPDLSGEKREYKVERINELKFTSPLTIPIYIVGYVYCHG